MARWDALFLKTAAFVAPEHIRQIALSSEDEPVSGRVNSCLKMWESTINTREHREFPRAFFLRPSYGQCRYGKPPPFQQYPHATRYPTR